MAEKKFDMEAAVRLKSEGHCIKHIARMLGVCPSIAYKHMNPNVKAKMNKDRREKYLGARIKWMFPIDRSAREDAVALIAEIPSDTRNLTGRMFGDPLPGRSALDRRLA